MTIFEFSVAEIPEVFAMLANFIRENPILCAALFISYILYYLYMFLNNKSVDSEIYEIDLLSCGISTIMIAFLLVGLDESPKGFDFTSLDFSTPTTRIAFFLFIYAFFLIVFAFTKKLPKFWVIILGNSEVDFFINFTAILLTDSNIKITGTMLVVIGVPLLILLIIQRLRRALK